MTEEEDEGAHRSDSDATHTPTLASHGSARNSQDMSRRSLLSGQALSISSEDQEVRIDLNNSAANKARKFPNNYMRTARYSLVTFIPLNLLEQFRRISNFYFLISMIVAQIPGISPFIPWAAVLPLVFIVLVSAIKDAVEDCARHRSDRRANKQLFHVFRDNESIRLKASEIVVGDIVDVRKGEIFPADLVLLSSSGHDGIAYVQTANLDGETNLKMKRAQAATYSWDSFEKLAAQRGRVMCQEPTDDLDDFSGRLELQDGSKISLSEHQLLLRGSELRNTANIYGLVVYTGEDTKLFRNLKQKSAKFSTLDRILNKFIVFMFGLQLVLILFVSGMGLRWQDQTGTKSFYISDTSSAGGMFFFRSMLTHFVLYSYFIPISLFVTLEIVKFGQARFMEWDHRMSTSTQEMRAKTSNLNDELALIDYVFTDKTGTLTQNIMRFSSCSVGGLEHNELVNPGGLEHALQGNHVTRAQAASIREFLLSMALCHEVVPEVDEESGNVNYEAQSTDEVALVKCAAENGYVFLERSMRDLVVEIDGHEEHFELLATLGFTSERKRSSVVVRLSNGTLRMYTKGADSVILPLLSLSRCDPMARQQTLYSLQTFSKEGLRTLLFGFRDLTEQEFMQWKEQLDEAENSTRRRKERLARVYEKLEKELELIGCSAIEDKLQEEVPDTIQWLRNAGIVVWVLTGDKRETAVNIGFSASLLDPNMMLCHVNASTSVQCKTQLLQHLHTIAGIRASTSGQFSLISKQYHDSFQEARPPGPVWSQLPEVEEQSLEDSSEDEAPPGPRLTYSEKRMQEIEEGSMFVRKPGSWRPRNKRGSRGQKERRDADEDSMLSSRRSQTSEVEEEEEEEEEDGDVEMGSSAGKTLRPPSGGGDGESQSSLRSPSMFLPNYGSSREEPSGYALIIDGKSLTYALGEHQDLFLSLCSQTSCAICCRANPLQKAKVVQLVQKKNKVIGLGIGDGANDVSMIQQARVGVGIMGLEGTQAARASDFAIPEFRKLLPLLAVHGRYSYLRNADVVQYSIYKNAILSIMLFFYDFYDGFSGTLLYDTWLFTLYNVMFTALPPLILGLFERDVSPGTAMKYPELFVQYRQRKVFTTFTMMLWVLSALYHASVIFFGTFLAAQGDSLVSNYLTSGLFSKGTANCTVLITVALLKCALSTRYWVWLSHFCLWGSLVTYYAVVVSYSLFPNFAGTGDMYWIFENLMISVQFWLYFAVLVVMCLFPDVMLKFLKRRLVPDTAMRFQKMDIDIDRFRRKFGDIPAQVSLSSSDYHSINSGTGVPSLRALQESGSVGAVSGDDRDRDSSSRLLVSPLARNSSADRGRSRSGSEVHGSL